MWGVWVSLSKESYTHYFEHFDDPDLEHRYFGWFCNYLPYYESTYALATDVIPQDDNQRPKLALHECEHELFSDFINGISITKAQQIAEEAMHGK